MFIVWIFAVLCHYRWWCRSDRNKTSPQTVLQAPWQVWFSDQHSSRLDIYVLECMHRFWYCGSVFCMLSAYKEIVETRGLPLSLFCYFKSGICYVVGVRSIGIAVSLFKQYWWGSGMFFIPAGMYLYAMAWHAWESGFITCGFGMVYHWIIGVCVLCDFHW